MSQNGQLLMTRFACLATDLFRLDRLPDDEWIDLVGNVYFS
jgi:hypothetical protein